MKKIITLVLLLFFRFTIEAQEIKSYNVQVTFNQTVHILFPSPVRYIDLGSTDIIAEKVESSGNVLKIKATVEDFTETTNLSVICEDGTFYSFKVTYARVPAKLNIVIANEIFSENFGNVPPRQVTLIMQSIYRENKSNIKYLGSKLFSVQTLVRSIYIHEDLYFIHLTLNNNSNIPFDIDLIRFKIADKKLTKRTAMQEIYIEPLTAYNEQTRIAARSSVRIVFVLQKFTLEDSKLLTIELHEKDGARNQNIQIGNEDLENAKTIEKLKLH